MEFLERETARCRRYNRALSLVLFDLDHFKHVNDDYGHLSGDEVLRSVGALVRKRVRTEDCFARYGGEEFAVVLTEANREAAHEFAEQLRETVEAHPFRAGVEPIGVTISLGVASLGGEMQGASDFLAAADARLYEAKAAGRNRVMG